MMSKKKQANIDEEDNFIPKYAVTVQYGTGRRGYVVSARDANEVIRRLMDSGKVDMSCVLDIHIAEILLDDDVMEMTPEAPKEPLLDFIRQEVPFRFHEVLDVQRDRITQELIDACVNELWENSHLLFDFDWIDRKLLEILHKMENG